MNKLMEQIRADLIGAQKQQQTLKVSVLRNLLSEAKNREIDLQHELTEPELVAVMRKQVKTLVDAQEMFGQGGREDLVEANQAEIDILNSYLPAEITDAELTKKVAEMINRHSEVSNVGQLTGLVIRELKDVAESNRIAKLVRELKAN